MARVTLTFEDVTQGPMDGTVNINLDPAPPMPLEYSQLTPAQKMAMVATLAVENEWEVLDRNSEIER